MDTLNFKQLEMAYIKESSYEVEKEMFDLTVIYFFWKLVACSLFVFFFVCIWTHVPKDKTCIKGVKFGACDSILDLVTVFKLPICI